MSTDSYVIFMTYLQNWELITE